MDFRTTMPIMINKSQSMNRILILLLSLALIIASGCAQFEKIPCPGDLRRAGHQQASDVCGCACAAAGVPCYGYHPTQWSQWPEWCECPSSDGTPTASQEPAMPLEELETTIAPDGQWPEVVVPPAEQPDTLPPPNSQPDGAPAEDGSLLQTHPGAHTNRRTPSSHQLAPTPSYSALTDTPRQ